MITSLGPKKSRTKLFKLKAIVAKKKVLAIFSPNNDCNKPQGKVYKGPKGNLTISMGGIRSFLYNIVCWKQKILKKRAIFPVMRRLWPSFSGTVECDKPQVTIYKGPKSFMTVAVAVTRSFA